MAFNFTTVRPGKYQLKVIWDKRAPFANDTAAGPGDYESALSPPLTVTAGAVISNIVLYCTNRVVGGEAYYRVDDELYRKLMDTGEITQFSFVPDKEGRKDRLWRNAKHWIGATNILADTNFAQIVSLGTTTYGGTPRESEIARPDCLDVVLQRKSWGTTQHFDGPIDLIIFDEHGCPYRQSFYFERRKTIRYTFQQFPRSARSWRLVGYSQSFSRKRPGDNVIFDYTVTNLVQSVRTDLAAKELPLDVNFGPIKMTVMKVSEDYLEPNIEAKFYQDGHALIDWFVRDAMAIDAEGNVINPRDMCREEKAFRIIGHAQHNESKETLPFEIVVPRSKKR